MGNRKKEQEAFEQMFKNKKSSAFPIPGGKGGQGANKAMGTQAKGASMRSTRGSNRGV